MTNSNINIDIKSDSTLKINIDKEELNLDKTLNCGQAFRWNKDSSNNWVGVVDNTIWVLKQYNNYIDTNIEKDSLNKLIYYFNLDMNYTNEISHINLNSDAFVRKAYEVGKGIHILRQDLLETIVTFLMSQFNSMKNIRNIVNNLCKTHGNKLTTNWNGDTYIEYSFPTLEILQKLDISDFEDLSMGFRAKYMYELCQKLVKEDTLLEKIKTSDYKKSIILLKSITGIGDKVANCISLFSLHHIEAFPIDLHINRIIQREYNGNIQLNKYNNIAGIIQQYMYHYEAFNKNKKII